MLKMRASLFSRSGALPRPKRGTGGPCRLPECGRILFEICEFHTHARNFWSARDSGLVELALKTVDKGDDPPAARLDRSARPAVPRRAMAGPISSGLRVRWGCASFALPFAVAARRRRMAQAPRPTSIGALPGRVRAPSRCDCSDRPDAAPFGWRRVLTQACHDLYGTKDVQNAITASYVWMADRIGHLRLGPAPTLLLCWILCRALSALGIAAHWWEFAVIAARSSPTGSRRSWTIRKRHEVEPVTFFHSIQPTSSGT